MSTKKKGQLTTDFEWRKHLRKIGKRFFWQKERKAEKKLIDINLSEYRDLNEFPSLTFDELFDFVEEDLFENSDDKLIVEKILEAERDWGDYTNFVSSLHEFTIVLENETKGALTQPNLKKLLQRYNQNLSKYAWEAESICSLLEIFELTDEKELRNIFLDLDKNIRLRNKISRWPLNINKDFKKSTFLI